MLDDNKKLCLVSGEIIALTAQMRMQFEVEDLSVASPATVSRCGMIYLEPSQLGWEPHVVSWLSDQPDHIEEAQREMLRALLHAFVPVGLEFVRKQIKQYVPIDEIMLVHALFRLLSSTLKAEAYVSEKNAKVLESWIKCNFVFCFAWSFGGAADDFAPTPKSLLTTLRLQPPGPLMLVTKPDTSS